MNQCGTLGSSATGSKSLAQIVGRRIDEGVDDVGAPGADADRVAVGRRRATRLTPVVPPAPPMFSTRIGWPSDARIDSSMVRTMVSTAPPAASGMTTVMGFDRKALRLRADTADATTASAATNARLIFTPVSLVSGAAFRRLLPLDVAALMIGHHLSASAFWNARNASGVCCSRGGASRPSSAKRLRVTVVGQRFEHHRVQPSRRRPSACPSAPTAPYQSEA